MQELTYPIWKQLPNSQKVLTDFNLSFRDISGFSKPTGQAYINQVDSLTGKFKDWKGLRLDYGPFPVKDAASGKFTMDPVMGKQMYAVGWHWNHHKAFDAFGIENHTEIKAGTFAETLGRTLEQAKPLGRAALVGGVALDAWAMGSALHTSLQSGDWDHTFVEAARIGGGWAGGWAGAQAGGGLGATIGTTFLPGIGTMVGGAVGGLLSGALGYLGGAAAGQSAAEQATGSLRPEP
ncbi:glr2119 [Gloeobacter violaceus PCC 7421]|uniref:Glr2119 protein n=1 Tax=Gloeobacter violaceus (strain ATCC 29082 / PCC 7421) TaxID=251221 RepID=Q7NIR3_GLOVI|nr:glr2119 [Gloeobacter violaceus PCC 7421]